MLGLLPRTRFPCTERYHLNESATLYVVATPIGNLGDMVPRAVQILHSVSLVAAEDTRHSRRLLEHFGIRTRCIAYHDHSGEEVVAGLIERLRSGDSIALISDAGTPLVSDPGYRLVVAAHAAGIAVLPIPGACAAIAALSAGGLPSDRFTFEGFLPARAGPRRQRLRELAREPRTLVLYEAPHRLVETLGDLCEMFGRERIGALARELTKRFETVLHAPLGDLLARVAGDADQRRGESVLLIAGCPEAEGEQEETARVLRLLLQELPLKRAVALAAEITGARRNALYQLALGWQASDD